ncbi:MAG: 4Fe-4S binding protein [Nitrospirota bacterium]|nr:MAG: 4Fe-4S binding protein [Nitrospirota bacterium]
MAATSTIHYARKASQAGFLLFVFLMPVFDILRYDVAAKELYIFRKVWTLGLNDALFLEHSLKSATHVAVHFFLNAVLPWVIVLSIFPILGFFLGRFFCGWMCPEGALFELSESLTLKLLGRRSLYNKRDNDPDNPKGNKLVFGIITALLIISVPPVTGAFLTGYFIEPARIWREVLSLDLSMGVMTGIIGVSIYIVTTSVFVRHVFCRYVCAPGLMQMLFGWASPLSLRMKFDRKNYLKCTDCKACEKACFMNVKPRLPIKDINCVNCGECIIACKKELGTDSGLFSYSLGEFEKDSEKKNNKTGHGMAGTIHLKEN